MFKKFIAVLLIAITSFITVHNISANTLQPLNVTFTVGENYYTVDVLVENPNDVELPFTISFEEGATTITKNYTLSPIDALGTKQFTQYNLQPYTHYDVTININHGELIHYDSFYTGEETPNTEDLSDFTINEYHYGGGSSNFELLNNSDLVVPFVVNLYDDSNTLIDTTDFSSIPIPIDGVRVVGFHDLLEDMDYTMEINMDNGGYIQTYSFNRTNKDIIYPTIPTELNPYYSNYYKSYTDIDFTGMTYTQQAQTPPLNIDYDYSMPMIYFSFSFEDLSSMSVPIDSIDVNSSFEYASIGNYITGSFNNITNKSYVYEVEDGVYAMNLAEFLDTEYSTEPYNSQDIRGLTFQFDINLVNITTSLSDKASFVSYDVVDTDFNSHHYKAEFTNTTFLPEAFRYLSSLNPLEQTNRYGVDVYTSPRYTEQINDLEQINIFGKNINGYYEPLVVGGKAISGFTLTDTNDYLTLKDTATTGDGLKILMSHDTSNPNTAILNETYGNFILDSEIGYTDFYIEVLKVKRKPNAPTINYEAESFHEITYTITNNEYSGMEFDIIDLGTGKVLVNQYIDNIDGTYTFTMERLANDTTYNLGVKGYSTASNLYNFTGSLLSTASVTTPPFGGLPITITENHDSFDYTIENNNNLFFDIEIITSYNHPIYGGISYNRIDDVNTQVNTFDTLEGSVEGLPFGENYNITVNVYYPDSEDLIQTENYAITTLEPVHTNYTRFDINAGAMGVESTESNLFNPYNLDNAIIYLNGHLILDKGKTVANNPFGFDSYLNDIYRYELATTNNASTYGDPNMVMQFWTSYTPFRNLLGEHGFSIGGYSLLYGEMMEQGDVLFIPDPVGNNLPAFNEITIFLGGYTSPSYVTEGNPTAPPGLAEIMANYGLFNVQGMLVIYFIIILIINIALVIWKIPVIGLLLINAIVTGIFVAMNFLPFWASLSVISLIIILFVMIIKGGVVSE